MGCCNQAPKGGTKGLAPLLKVVGILLVLIIILASIAG